MDWGFAFKVAGIGFGGVFLVLVILAVILWLSGVQARRASKRGTESPEEQGKEKHGSRDS